MALDDPKAELVTTPGGSQNTNLAATGATDQGGPRPTTHGTGSLLIRHADLLADAERILGGLGAKPVHAARVARSLVEANLVGHDSHGVQLLLYYEELIGKGDIAVAAEPKIVADEGNMALIDGQFAFGQVVGEAAVKLGLERVEQHGLAAVVARNASHIGRLGEYTAMVADAGNIGCLLVNFQGGDQRVVPHGGRDRRLSNNPISFAVPGPDGPIVLDIALSVIAEAKVWLAKARGASLPEGAIIDSEGRPTTDPDAFLQGGALLPLGGAAGGHKGFGLIVLVDLIVGALSGGGLCTSPDSQFSNAFVIVIIDPNVFATGRDRAPEVAAFSSYVKSARLVPGASPVMLPGEPESRARAERIAKGIPIELATRSALAELAKRVGVEPTALRALTQ